MGGRSSKEQKEADSVEQDFEEDDDFATSLRLHLQRLIFYAASADPQLQREVAERLANEAVKSHRQQLIVDLGGLRLLLPLTKSVDGEVQRLAAHALANLSVNVDNQVAMARDGATEMLIDLLRLTRNEQVQRRSAKALANLAVNTSN